MASQRGDRFRLRPRRAWAVWSILAFGAVLCALPFLYGVGGTARLIDVVAGGGVVGTAAAYLASPTWRSYVVVDERGLSVMGPRRERLRLSWAEVTEVIADEEERAALVRGPRSFLVPSPGHPAPYRVERSEELYALIVARTPEGKLRRSREFK